MPGAIVKHFQVPEAALDSAGLSQVFVVHEVEVQVRSSRVAGVADVSDVLAGFHRLASGHAD